MTDLVSNKRTYCALSFDWLAISTEVYLGMIFFEKNYISEKFDIKTFYIFDSLYLTTSISDIIFVGFCYKSI